MIDEARAIAQEAGLLLLERFGRLSAGEIDRQGRRDVSTAADRESEALITQRLERLFPDHRVLGEESAKAGVRGRRTLDRPTWIVDPLDGTVNFIQGIPLFAVSIGLVDAGRPILGVVHAPALGQTFWGAPGSGCFEGSRPVAVSATPWLEESLLATGLAYRRNELPDTNLDNIASLGMRVRDLRRMGSAALDLAYVASGRLDGYWELHLEAWDAAAGAALVRAAGGRVTDLRGGDDWLFGGHLLATNGLLHEELRSSLAPLRGL